MKQMFRTWNEHTMFGTENQNFEIENTSLIIKRVPFTVEALSPVYGWGTVSRLRLGWGIVSRLRLRRRLPLDCVVDREGKKIKFGPRKFCFPEFLWSPFRSRPPLASKKCCFFLYGVGASLWKGSTHAPASFWKRSRKNAFHDRGDLGRGRVHKFYFLFWPGPDSFCDY